MVIIVYEHAKKFKPPTRFGIGAMFFMACLMSYMMKVNFSINVVAMVTRENASDYGPRYNWNKDDEALLVGSYFYGYLITSLPGGVLAEKLGGRNVAGYTLFASAIVTALMPIAASWNKWAVFVVRFVIGLLGGVVYPSCHSLISKWAPPDEKGKFVAALMGGTFGTVITWPIIGVIIENLGWVWADYIVAIFCGTVTIIWFIVVADSPSQHKWISIDEQKYIETSLGDAITKSKKWPPFLSLITSLPFIALALLHYGNMWGLSFLITSTPKFMSNVLNFDIAKSGFYASLPHLARLILAFGFGSIVDAIRRRNRVSVTLLRKSFCLFSHIIPGLFLIILAFFGRDPMVCVAILTMSLGFNGAATVTNLQNSQDLAPNYAGTLYGTINFLGTTPGFFAPQVVAAFTDKDSTMEHWKYVFFIGAAVYIVPAIFFILFGSGTVQKWNFIENTKNQKDDELESTNQTHL